MYKYQDPRTVDRLGYSLDPLAETRNIPEDDLAKLKDIIDRREQKGRVQGYTRPVQDLDLFAANNSAQLGSLAKAISNMSASAGSFYGKTPDQMGFGGIVDDINENNRRDIQNRLAMEKIGDDTLLENIKLNEFYRKSKRERELDDAMQKNLDKPLSEEDRRLAEQTIRQFDDTYRMPTTFTYRNLQNSPILSELYPKLRGIQSITPYQQGQLGLGQIRLDQEAENARVRAEIERERLAAQKERERLAAQRESERLAAQRERQNLDKAERERLRKEKQESAQKPQINELRKSEEVGAVLTNDISELESLVKQYGTSEPTNQVIDAKMQALASDIRLNLKELNNLGVLNGPDLAILQEQIPPVGGIKGMGLINSRALSQLAQAKEQIAKKVRAKREFMPPEINEKVPKGPATKGTFPKKVFKGNQEATVQNEQELKEAQAEGWK